MAAWSSGCLADDGDPAGQPKQILLSDLLCQPKSLKRFYWMIFCASLKSLKLFFGMIFCTSLKSLKLFFEIMFLWQELSFIDLWSVTWIRRRGRRVDKSGHGRRSAPPPCKNQIECDFFGAIFCCSHPPHRPLTRSLALLRVVHVAQVLLAGAITNILMNVCKWRNSLNKYENRNAICNLKMTLFFARCSFRKTYRFFRICVACIVPVNITKSDRLGFLCLAERLWESRIIFRWLVLFIKQVFPVKRT